MLHPDKLMSLFHLLVLFTSVQVCITDGILHHRHKKVVYKYNVQPESKYGNADFFSYFLKEAYKHPGDYKINHTAQSIPWLDPNLLNRSVESYKKNYVGIVLATLWSGIELFAIKSTTSVLMCSGTVNNRNITMTRIIRTALHSKYWSNAGMTIFDQTSTAYKSINSVRMKHHSATYAASNRSAAAVEFMDKNILEPPVNTNWEDIRNLAAAIKADLEFVDTSDAPSKILNWDTPSSVGQFDLGMVQFIIISNIVMNTKEFGIFAKQEDLLAYIHASAVFGKLLGIEDRFNVALNLPLDMYEKFYRNIVVASFKIIDEHILHVMSMTMESMSEEFPVPQFLRLKCWLYYSFKSSVKEFKGERIYKLMNWKDKVCLKLLDLFNGPINKIPIYNHLSEFAINEWLQYDVNKRGIIFP